MEGVLDIGGGPGAVRCRCELCRIRLEAAATELYKVQAQGVSYLCNSPASTMATCTLVARRL